MSLQQQILPARTGKAESKTSSGPSIASLPHLFLSLVIQVTGINQHESSLVKDRFFCKKSLPQLALL